MHVVIFPIRGPSDVIIVTTGIDIPIAAYEKDRQRGPCPKRVIRLNIQN